MSLLKQKERALGGWPLLDLGRGLKSAAFVEGRAEGVRVTGCWGFRIEAARGFRC